MGKISPVQFVTKTPCVEAFRRLAAHFDYGLTLSGVESIAKNAKRVGVRARARRLAKEMRAVCRALNLPNEENGPCE